MKKIICLVITLLMTLPAYAKLTAHEEARINAMLEGLAQKKDLIFVRNGDEHTCDEAVSHLRLKLGKDLNLTDAQKQQIREIMKGQRDQMKRPPLEERRAMHDIIASDSFDKAKAEAQIDKMAEQHKARMLAHMETQNKIYNILTPEQKKQFNANFEKRLTERAAPEGKMPAPTE